MYPSLRYALLLGSVLLAGCNTVPPVSEKGPENIADTGFSKTLESIPEPAAQLVIEEQSITAGSLVDEAAAANFVKPQPVIEGVRPASSVLVANNSNVSRLAGSADTASQVAPREDMSPTNRIELWLAQAELAMDKDQLTTPADNNAYVFYARMLMQDENNALALQGLERIVQRYLILAKSAHKKGKFKQSHLFLSRASKVVPGHAQIAAVTKQLAQSKAQAVSKVKKKAKKQPNKAQQLTIYKPLQTQQQSLLDAPEGMQRQRILLPPGALKHEASALAIYLRGLARQIEQVDGRLYIIAPRDKQVRWVYGLLYGTNPDYRIRANIKHKSPAAIEVIYKADTPLLDVFH